VVHDEVQGNLWYIRYPVLGADRFLVVATTRPETMLGDTAVAVNPRDERYRDLHGGSVLLPLMDRQIPIILDELADPEFATGVVKVTPAHDPNDFEVGRRHNLPKVQVIDGTGQMTSEAGRYAGLDRFEARRRVLADLDRLGLIEKIEPYSLSLGKCQRCKTPIEPLVSIQWFVKTKPLAEPAIRAVQEGRIRFIPENWTKTYYEWMYNIRDWCISRQLWWGHRIPAYYCEDCGQTTVARQAPSRCAACGSPRLDQDPDVLDTWFSSALWPFSTLGWPEQTEDLRSFYPTSLLITGFDILFFWVARMIMMGLECVGDVPFREVYIHGLVRDAERQKMSKTRGNVIDPLEVTEKYGTDAVRLSLLLGAAPGTDIVLTEERMLSARAFANKIWNAARFLLLNMERSGVTPWLATDSAPRRPEPPAPGEVPHLEDRWMFSRLNRTAEAANRAIERYRYHEAAQLLWQFFWHEFCDWYVEIKKLRFRENSGLNGDWRNILTVFEAGLRLLHPAMPFLTEELWQRLAAGQQGRPVSIALARYPTYDPAGDDSQAEQAVEQLQQIIIAARNLRSTLQLDPKKTVEAVLFSTGPAADRAQAHREVIERLAGVRLEVRSGAAPPAPCAALCSTPDFDLLLGVPQAESEAQRRRLAKEIERLEALIASSERQLANQEFLDRAPDQVVASLREKLSDYQAQLAKNREVLATLSQG